MSRPSHKPYTEEIWYAEAACRGIDVAESNAVFFPLTENKRTAQFARQEFCGACPVRQECLSSALHRGEPVGIWAGTTTTVRNRLLRRRSRIKCPVCLCYDLCFVQDAGGARVLAVFGVCVACGASWTTEQLALAQQEDDAARLDAAELEQAA